MNSLFSISLVSFCLLILTGCNFKDEDRGHAGFSGYTPINNTDYDGSDGSDNNADLVVCEATPEPIERFVRVQLTYGLLDQGAFIPGESEGLLPITLSAPVSKGATVITVDSTASLVDKQLLTYLGTNNRYFVAQIKDTTATEIILEEPLYYDLAAGTGSLWNFYDDAVHANERGFKAISDFAFSAAYDDLEPNSVHLLLGDSWFRRNGATPFEDRLLERLPSGSVIKNEGIGGHSLCGLLGRVDNAIDTHNPSYVWINSSINDFFDGVTQEEYKDRMQTLIYKVQQAGATAIVMDPAPGMIGQSTSDGRTFKTLSQRYAVQIQDLLAETAGSAE